MVGGENLTLYVYTQVENSGIIDFERTQTLKIKASVNEINCTYIKSLDIDIEAEEYLVCVTNSRQLYQVKMRNESRHP